LPGRLKLTLSGSFTGRSRSGTGTAPQRFGVSIQRRDEDSYAVRLLWDRTCFIWSSLARAQLLTSALAPLLAAMGTDLWCLLDQPIRTETGLPRKAA